MFFSGACGKKRFGTRWGKKNFLVRETLGGTLTKQKRYAPLWSERSGGGRVFRKDEGSISGSPLRKGREELVWGEILDPFFF